VKSLLSAGRTKTVIRVSAIVLLLLVSINTAWSLAPKEDDYVLVAAPDRMPEFGNHPITPTCMTTEEARTVLGVRSYKQASFNVRRRLGPPPKNKSPFALMDQIDAERYLIMTRACADIILDVYNMALDIIAEEHEIEVDHIKPIFLISHKDVLRELKARAKE